VGRKHKSMAKSLVLKAGQKLSVRLA